MAVSLKDIAIQTQLTPSAVSKILSPKADRRAAFSAETCRRVIDVARELGYVPHFSARQMAKQRSFSIGVVLMMHPESIPRDLSTFVVDYAHEAILGVESVCNEHDYNCLINVQRVDKGFKLPRMMRDGSVDGVVIVGPSDAAILRQFAQAKIDCVHVGGSLPQDMGVPFVAPDLKKKFCEVSEACFRRHGLSRQMTCLKKGPGPGKIEKYFVDLNNSVPGLRNESMLLPDCWEEQRNKKVFRDILTRPNRPEVLFVEATHVGYLLEVMGELRLKIPDDLNVVTYGIESVQRRLESVYSRSFAMITFSAEEVGRLAARLLLKQFGDYEEEVPRSMRFRQRTNMYRAEPGLNRRR
jgi:DNA-binding LacI/PurR family transcriptional regulator